MRPRSGRLGAMVFAAAALALLLAACGGGDKQAALGSRLADRWMRLGEDIGTGVDVYEGALPPQLPQLLNPDLPDGTGPDAVALPVHPAGELLGSFHVHRGDGSNLVWILFDVPGGDADAEHVISQQLDQSPWQVVGGQSSEALSVVRFQSTTQAGLTGTAVIQPLPSTSSYELTVDRGGKQSTLEVARGAPVPVLAADLVEQNGVLVRGVVPGAAAAAGLQANDRIVSVNGTAVKTVADVDRALHALVDAGTKKVTLAYILDIGAPKGARTPTFVLPPSRALPGNFPAPFLVQSGMTVLDVNWSSQAQGNTFQATLLSQTNPNALAQAFRDVLKQQGWKVTNDQAVGFATQLDFTSGDSATTGRAQIDAFTGDPSLTSVTLQIQTTGH